MRKFNPDKELYKIQCGNKNRVILFVISLLVVGVIGYSFALYQVRYSKRIIYTKVGEISRDINLAVYVDGVKQNGFPEKEEGYVYTKTVCDDNDDEHVKTYWDSEDWSLIVETSKKAKCNVYFNEGKEFNYTGGEQIYTVPKDGIYRLEVWGAQGGSTFGGKGGYAVGNITLTKDQILYIVVGGTGTLSKGGYNGGGNPDTIITKEGFMASTPQGISFGGGGATHIAKVTGELKNLIDNQVDILIVAGGGGGGGYDIFASENGNSSVFLDPYVKGGPGGNEVGGEGTNINGNHDQGYPGTQTSAGICPTFSDPGLDCGGFGYGGNYATQSLGGNGGGGGWYGGSGSDRTHAGGAGGSGHLGEELIEGTTNMETGIREGNGFVRITYFGP